MLDIKYIVENAEAVKHNCRRRHVDETLVDRAVYIRGVAKAKAQEHDALIHEQRTISKRTANETGFVAHPDTAIKSLLKDISNKVKGLADEIAVAEKGLNELLKLIPNTTHPEVQDELRVLRGHKNYVYYAPCGKNHVEIAEELDIANFVDAAAITGSKFYYLKNKGVLLEHALTRFAFDKVMNRGFTLWQTPDIARDCFIEDMGFVPRGEASQIYNIEGDRQSLIGTSEITLGALLSRRIIDKKQLPIRYAGVSHCFRKEAGAPGKENKGLYRVHQFTKVEMFIFCTPEQSNGLLEELLSIEEEIYQDLRLPYRVVDIPPYDLGNPAYRKYDIEVWMPGRGEWGEVTSCSNCTDYQARRLKTRYQGDDPKDKEFVHTLNGTAIAMPRTILSILENYYENGSVLVPDVLQQYMGCTKIP